MGQALPQGTFAAVSHGVNALVFLYGQVLEQPLEGVAALRAERQPHVPVVLTP
ncbi:MAG: hypothetical protein KIS67_13920 [Verrucomicrobiae bacterium]|nr:hypothetical protein [Verrucomicrobiae bacterium]